MNFYHAALHIVGATAIGGYYFSKTSFHCSNIHYVSRTRRYYFTFREKSAFYFAQVPTFCQYCF